MTSLDKLIAYFEKFPGIGGRQAKRFAFHILTLKREQVEELAELITTLQTSVAECSESSLLLPFIQAKHKRLPDLRR